MTFNKPNLTAPRYRQHYINVLSRDLFKRFLEKYPKYSDLDYQLFKEVIKKDNQKISDIIVENKDGVELREQLGNIFIGSCEAIKDTPINYGESIKTGTLVLHKNWDTDNRLAKVIYTIRDRCSFQNRCLWVFVPVRDLARNSSQAFKKEHTKYIQISNKVKISTLLKDKNNEY